MSDQPIVAYCMKCREKREMQEPVAVFTSAGTPATQGVCAECGTKLFRMGRTPAHEGLPKPEVKPRAKKKAAAKKKSRSASRLVIVESPAKARTVGRFLGRGYRVRASIGHVRDLLRSRLSVDVDDDFKPTYRVPNDKREVVKELRAEVKKAGEVFLATDLDREGEAIAWHLIEAVGMDSLPVHRVVFHEITRDAIAEAFAHPRDINMRLVNAQQARRILDRLVGYQISPLLWDRVRGRLSAGRVQSVALRLVVEREREIQAFAPEEYWSLEAELAKQDSRSQRKRPSFLAALHRVRGQKIELKTEAEAQAILDALEGATYIVDEVRKRERRRRPAPPFTTSTMQQRASQRLGFNARRTMRVAQQLYEGIDIGDGGAVGLITYMRTDSVNVAAAAQSEARDYIGDKLGAQYLPPKPPVYKTRSKSAQEAHEAIRPTSVWREPKAIRQHLTRDQYRLYSLIWQRFLASQMAPAVLDTTSVDIKAGNLAGNLAGEPAGLSAGEMPYLFRATGSVVKFPGFLVLYRKDDEETEKDKILPPLSEGEILDLLRLIPEQHFTKPAPRYSEATLVKALEEHGIGRPSTYASIMSTIQQRGYVENIEKRLHPTKLGFVVNDLLVEHFPDVIDVGFTAQMEGDLDRIASGEKEWVPILREFYGPFSEALEHAQKNMKRVVVADEPTGETCPECGKALIIKWGRFGKFVGCSNFPNCRYTTPLLVKTGAICPECGGDLVEKRTRKRRRTFYGCANYPGCEFATWSRPLPQPCPSCGGLLTVSNKEWAKCAKCQEQLMLASVEVASQ